MRAGPVPRALPDGLSCPSCASDRFCGLSTRRTTFKCNHCKRKLSLLASTLFQATKLPPAISFLAMHLLSQTKNGILALELGRRLGVNDSTAWLLKHKLMQAMRERDQAYGRAGRCESTPTWGREPGWKARAGLGEQDAHAGGRAGH